MGSLLFSFVMDMTVAGLLAATIFYCWKLNHRIRVLQDSKSELAQLIRQFDESTERATASIVEIQNASRKISENIQLKLDKANFLADDLSYMIERGGKLADQMEAGISASRKLDRPAAAAPSPATSRPAASAARTTPPPAPPASSAPERPVSSTVRPEIPAKKPVMATAAANPLQAVHGANPLQALQSRLSQTASSQSKTATSLESVLERIAARPAAGGKEPAGNSAQAVSAPPGGGSRTRSKAEQELFDALKAGR